MFYRVIKSFTDLNDNNHVYFKGDVFPRDGSAADNARFLELSTKANKRGEVLIEAVEPEQTADISPVKREKKQGDESVDEVEKAPRKAKKEK